MCVHSEQLFPGTSKSLTSDFDSKVTLIHVPSIGGCPLEQYFSCSFLANWISPMTVLLRASAMAPHVGFSLDVNHVRKTSLSWSPGSPYWTLKRSKVPTSTWSWTPRLYHLEQHGKVPLWTAARSVMPKGAPETVDVKKQVRIPVDVLVYLVLALNRNSHPFMSLSCNHLYSNKKANVFLPWIWRWPIISHFSKKQGNKGLHTPQSHPIQKCG